MGEREVRSDAGHHGDGTYRVDLTRRCLTSGIVQLPLALRDRIPEGDIVGADVEREVAFDLRCTPPRHLAGLRPFFEAHELEVNDAVEFRLAEGAVRLAPVKRARKSEREREGGTAYRSSWSAFLAEQEPARTKRVAYGDRGAHAPPSTAGDGAGVARPSGRAAVPTDATEHDASEHGATERATTEREATERVATDREASGPDEVRVVERIGSVTVRRLGRGDLARPAPSVPAEVQPAASESLGTEALPPDPVPPEPGSTGSGTSEPTRRRVGGPAEVAATVDADRTAADARAAAAGAELRTPTAPAAGPAPTPTAPKVRRTRGRAYGVRPVRREEPVVTEDDLADPNDRRPRMVLGPPRPVHEVERDRQEQVSRFGDLRSRIVRWLLDPSTPVIVPFDRVQRTFELEPQVAAEMMQGILDEPPPSLRLTPLREGIVRVSRVTVSVED